MIYAFSGNAGYIVIVIGSTICCFPFSVLIGLFYSKRLIAPYKAIHWILLTLNLALFMYLLVLTISGLSQGSPGP